MEILSEIYLPPSIIKFSGNTSISFQESTNIGQFTFTPKYLYLKLIFTVSIPFGINNIYFNVFITRNGTNEAINTISSHLGRTYGIITYNLGVAIAGHLLFTGVCYNYPTTTSQITYYLMGSASGSVPAYYQAGPGIVKVEERIE